jgi:hypothetical protein
MESRFYGRRLTRVNDKKRNHARNLPPEVEMYNNPVGNVEVEMVSR